MNIDFYLAKHKHLMWKIRLKAFLIGLKDMEEKQVVSHHDCDLGKWLDNFAMNEYKNIEELKKLEKLHIKMHNVVADIIRVKNENNMEEACKLYKMMKAYSDNIIALLDIVDNKLKQIG